MLVRLESRSLAAELGRQAHDMEWNMAKGLGLLGVLFLAGGVVASLQSADATLRMLPALFLPLPTSLAAGPDLPPHLTTSGIVVVYFVPGALLLVIAAMWATFRKGKATIHSRGA
jgi:hypothetical protein